MAKTKDKSIFVSSVDCRFFICFLNNNYSFSADSDIEEIIMPPKPPVEVIQLDDSDDGEFVYSKTSKFMIFSECQDICKPIYNKKVHKDPIVRVSYRQRIPGELHTLQASHTIHYFRVILPWNINIVD